MKIDNWRFKDGFDKAPGATAHSPIVDAHIEGVGWAPFSSELQAVLLSHHWYSLRDFTHAW